MIPPIAGTLKMDGVPMLSPGVERMVFNIKGRDYKTKISHAVIIFDVLGLRPKSL
jgi:hypothetical protein